MRRMQTQTNSENILGIGEIKHLILKLAIPSVVAQIINILYNIVDKIYVGHLEGTQGFALAGLGICAPLILLIASFSMFVCGGGAPIAAIFLGEGKKEKSEVVLGVSLFLLLCNSIILTIVSFLFQDSLLRMFGAVGSLFPYAKAYFGIYLFGTVFVQIALGLNVFIVAQGKAKTAMLSISIGAICNIVLDPIFIFTLKMGVAGAAVATIISQALSAIFVLAVLISERSEIRLKRKNIRCHFSYTKKILALGVSPFIMQATESAITLVFNRQLLVYGNERYIAALAIMQSLMQLLVIPISGFTSGVQPIMSYNFGAKKYKRVIETIKYSLLMTLFITVIYNAFVALFPGKFAAIFTAEKELIHLVEQYLLTFMLGMWVFPVQMVTQTFLVGTNQPKASLFIAVLRKVLILIPLSLILPIYFGVNGIFSAEPIADITSVTISGMVLLFSIRGMLKKHQG